MPKYQVIARPTGMKRDQPVVEVVIAAPTPAEAALRLRAQLAGRDEYIITSVKEVLP